MKRFPSGVYKSIEGEIVIACVDVIVLNQDNEVLLGYRKEGPIIGWWIFGGRMSVGEDYKQTTSRVLDAELGISKYEWREVVGHYLLNYLKEEYGKNCTHLLVAPKVIITEKQARTIPAENNEHTKIQFFSVEELNSLPMDAYLRNVLTDAKLI